MEAENRVVLEQFMSCSLVSWVRTFGRLGDKEGNVLSEFTELVDGLFLNKVMNQINPKATIQGLSKVNNNDMCQRAQNLCVLMYHIKSYYQDTLQQLIMMSPPNVLLMGRNPLSEETLMEIKKILLLLLGCAVQCERKEEYIEMIQNLDFDTKAAIATHIQEVTHSQENVFDLHWLEMEGLCPEEWENLSRSLMVNLKTVVDQRDRQFETLVELMQGKEWMKSAVFSGHPSLIESGQSQLSQQHLAQELTEAKAKIKCLRQELEEKSEHLLDCRQDIDNLDVELKRLQQENMQLLADSRAARMYRDELDAMKERAIAADKLESEVSRYKDKLHSLNFYKAKLEELKEDNQVLMDSKTFLEDQLESSRARYEKLNHLEKHNVLLEAKLHDMEEEKAMNRRHIEELLEKNVVLELSQKRSMEESQRLGWELELAKSPQQNSGSVSEQKSLSQEVTEMTCSRLLKLEKENQRLLKTLEELQGVGCHLNGFNSNTGCFSRNGAVVADAECPSEYMKAGPANNQTKNITQSTDREHEHPHPPLENGTSTVQYPQLESHENESLQDSVQSRQHRKALGKENGGLYEETTCLSETYAEKRKLERKNVELIQQAEIDKKMLNALREELLDQKLKIQLKESDLEKQTYELEKMKLNVEIRMGDNGLAKQGKRKILESGLESSLMKSLKMKKERMATLESRLQESFRTNQQLREDFKTVKQNYEAFLQRSEKGNEGHRSPPEKAWESHEATWALLKLKDRLIEVERNNATLEAEKQALHTQLQSVKTQSDGLQAQIIALQQQTASLQENCTSLQMLNAQLQVEKSSASSQNSSLMAHNSQLQRERQGLEVEREGIMREREDLRTVNELLLRDHERLSVLHERQAAELEVVSHRYSMMENSHRSLEIEHRSLEDRYNSLLQQRAQLEGLERALREEQQKMQSEICTHKSTTAEYQRLRDEKDWLNQTYQKLLAENEGLQVEHSHVKSKLISCNLEQTQMDSELRKLKEQNQHLDIAAIKLTNQCELLTQLKGNLEEENRHLLDQIQSLMLQNRSLLDQTMESKDLFHVEQRQYIDKLNDLRRQKEKLEEKIMDQYKFYEPSPTRRRGNWITLKMRKLMKTKTRDQEQGCSTAAQVDGLDDLHLPESSFLVESQGSEESTSNSLNDVPSPKRIGLTPLKIFHTKRKRPKDKEKVKSRFCRSLSLNDLFSVSGQQEEQEEHILQQNIALSNKHSTLWSSIHHFSSIDDHETILNKGSKFEGDESQQNFANEPDFQRNGVRDRPNRAPSASSGEYSISLENEAWSSDSSPLLDISQQSRDTSIVRPNDGDLSSDRRVRRSYSGRSYTDRSVKKDKDNNGLCKTQSVYGSEVETKPTLESQGKSSSASGCLNCFAPPMRSPKPGQAFSTLPRASSVISTSEGNSRRASTSSGLSLGSGTNKTTARASFIQPDTKEDGLKSSHVLEEDEQSELIFDSSFTIDSVFTNTIFSETA